MADQPSGQVVIDVNMNTDGVGDGIKDIKNQIKDTIKDINNSASKESKEMVGQIEDIEQAVSDLESKALEGLERRFKSIEVRSKAAKDYLKSAGKYPYAEELKKQIPGLMTSIENLDKEYSKFLETIDLTDKQTILNNPETLAQLDAYHQKFGELFEDANKLYSFINAQSAQDYGKAVGKVEPVQATEAKGLKFTSPEIQELEAKTEEAKKQSELYKQEIEEIKARKDTAIAEHEAEMAEIQANIAESERRIAEAQATIDEIYARVQQERDDAYSQAMIDAAELSAYIEDELSRRDESLLSSVNPEEMAGLYGELEGLTEYFANLTEAMDTAYNSGGDMSQVAQRLEVTEDEIVEAILSIRRFRQESAGAKEEVKDSTNYLTKLGNAAKVAFIKMKSIDVGKGFNHMKQSASGLLNEINKVGRGFKQLASITSRSTPKMQNSFKNLFRKILNYGIGITTLTMLFNKLRNVVKEDFKLMGQDIPDFGKKLDGMKSSLEWFKHSIGSAFEPIASIALPYLERLLNYLSTVFDMLGQISAAIFGQKQYAKAIKKTTEATKEGTEANKAYLSPIDTIHQYTSNKGSGSSSSGGSGFFEMEDVSEKAVSIADKFKAFVQKILDATEPFREALKRLWDEGLSKLVNFTWGALQDFYNDFLVPIGKWAFGEDTGLTRLVNLFNAFLNDIHWDDIRQALDDFWTAIEPYAEQFGEGLIDFLGDCLDFVKDNIINKIPDFLNGITDALNNGDPEKARKWGYNFGVVALGIFAIITVAKLAGFLTGLISNLALLGKVALILAAIDFGWRVGNWLYELFTGEHCDLSPLEQLQAILQDFTSGHYKDTFKEMYNEMEKSQNNLLEEARLAVIAILSMITGYIKKIPGLYDLGSVLEANLNLSIAKHNADKQKKEEQKQKDLEQKIRTQNKIEENRGKYLPKLPKSVQKSAGAGAIDTIREAAQEGAKSVAFLNQKLEETGTTSQKSGSQATAAFDSMNSSVEVNSDQMNMLNDILGNLNTSTSDVGVTADETFASFGEDLQTIIDAMQSDESIEQYIENIGGIGVASSEMKDEVTTNWGLVDQVLKGTEPFDTIDNNFAGVETDSHEAKDSIVNDWNTVSTELTTTEPWDYLGSELSEETWNGYGSNLQTGVVDNGMQAAVDSINQLKEDNFSEEAWKLEGVSNGMSGAFGAGIELIKAGWNAFAEWAESHLSLDILSLLPGISPGIAQSIKTVVGSDLKIKLPRLAKGAVIPPNRQFLAMLGDQTSGTNIEAPLETIKQAVREVVGNGKGETVTVNLTLDRRVLAQAVIAEGKVIKATSNRNIFNI